MKTPGWYVAMNDYGKTFVQVGDSDYVWIAGNEMEDSADRWTFLAGPFTVESLMAHGELLACLKDLVPLAKQAMEEACADGQEYDIAVELAEARAAIAKAEGKS